MSEDKIVWSDEGGDLRSKKNSIQKEEEVIEEKLLLHLRRLTSGKGRTIIEISALPNNKKWCQKLEKDLKKSLGVGGSYKNQVIEIHGEKIDLVTDLLNSKKLKWKKIGG